jgi:hypothetical protein
MPLQHLVDCFNQRFIEENGLTEPPLAYDGQRVEGRFGGLAFTSRLQRAVEAGSNNQPA